MKHGSFASMPKLNRPSINEKICPSSFSEGIASRLTPKSYHPSIQHVKGFAVQACCENMAIELLRVITLCTCLTIHKYFSHKSLNISHFIWNMIWNINDVLIATVHTVFLHTASKINSNLLKYWLGVTCMVSEIYACDVRLWKAYSSSWKWSCLI